MNRSDHVNGGLNTGFSQRSETVLSVALLGVLVVLIIPLPPTLLDMLLAFNLALTILLLLVTLSASKALDFSVFPSLLLLMTLLRLSLNVATTRLILLHGSAGKIVSAFGNFVVGGNLIVGLVVFLILIIIQFVVITKGAGRISEVAARFTLDALPGKQMAIDAELNAGAIDDAEARRRRKLLMSEAEFHGAMDGASKFVRGDAIAGLFITAINLIGGVIIGMTRSMTIAQAVHNYSILTVGDGLISQIPALIVATAAGILVTKATSETSLGQEIGSQVLANPRPLTVGATIMGCLALAPGLPKLTFLGLAACLWYFARRLSTPHPKTEAASEAAAPGKTSAESHLDDFLQTDRACVEIGARLIPLVNPKRGIGILDRIGALRRELARRCGLWVPPIRVRDNLQLDAEAYRILVGGREVARDLIRPDHFLAIDPGTVRTVVSGEETKDPAFGMPARWVSENDRQRAELAGYTVVDATSVLITHLGEIVRRHAHELLGREDLKKLVDKIKETSPTVVDELIPNVLTMGVLHRILTLLLEERVPMTNLTRILESLGNHVTASSNKDPVELAERVRVDMGRAICDRFRDEHGRVRAIVFDPRVEVEMRRAIHDKNLVLDPARLEKLVTRLANEWHKASMRGQEVALLVDSSLRRPLRQALARAMPDLSVIAYPEVPNDMLLGTVAVIKLEEIVPAKGDTAPQAVNEGGARRGAGTQMPLASVA